jgi:hypothetical protein
MPSRASLFAYACVFGISFATYYVGWWTLLLVFPVALIAYVWEGGES